MVCFICFIWYFNENLCGLDQYFTFKVLFQCELTDSICDTSPLFPGSWFVNVSHMSSSYWLMETADANSSHQWFHHITCSVDDCRKLSINFLTLWQPASGEEKIKYQWRVFCWLYNINRNIHALNLLCWLRTFKFMIDC